MGWNVFPVITIKKAQNNGGTSEKYKHEDTCNILLCFGFASRKVSLKNLLKNLKNQQEGQVNKKNRNTKCR